MPDTQKPVEVFYSYAPEDKHWLKRLDTHLSVLKYQSLISVWHYRQIVPGADWAQEIDAHLNSASVILLLVSPDFLSSDYCYGIEMQRALERDQAQEARVIPILLRPVDWHSAPIARLQVLPLDAKPITTWSNKDNAFADVTAGIRRAIEDLSLRTINTSSSTLWNVPIARNPFFLGREDLLVQLHTQLQNQQAAALSQWQALSGLGGIGKTQLAVEYAYRYRESYQAVLWIRAESIDTLNASYSELAILLALPEQHANEQEALVQAVKRWLQTQKGWLLILDNADEPEILAPFLPQPMGGQLVLTTRASALRRFGIAYPLTVETFTPEHGALFLLRRAGALTPDAPLEQASIADRTVALQLTRELDGLPLALDQAGAYVEATGSSLVIYQQIYQHHRAELLQERRGTALDHPEPVASTWSLSIQRVEERNPAAAELLRFCAFLAPDTIGEEILSEGATYLGPLLAPVAADGYLLNQSIEMLRAYSLIERDTVARTLAVHRLVQESVRSALSSEQQHEWIQRMMWAINATFPDVEFKNWPMCERLLPHVLLAARWMEQVSFTKPLIAHLLNQTGAYLQERARYLEAEPLLQQALTIWRSTLGEEHSLTLTGLNNLACIYLYQGRYPEAEPLLQQALTIGQRTLSEKHPDTVKSMNNLACLYLYQGKYSEAEPLLQQALTIWQHILGEEHPDTTQSMNNLAILYLYQGRYSEAESIFQQVLTIRQKVLGDGHPDTAGSLNNLASLYVHQRKYVEAEPLLQQALALEQHTLGEEHPDTTRSMNNLANLYENQGKYAEAEPLYQRALAVRERVLGEIHPATATSLNNLGNLYSHQGKYAEAEPLYQRALAVRKRVLGEKHPDTAQSMNNLGHLYLQQRKYGKAETLLQQGLAIWQRALGDKHPDTLPGLENLAALYIHRGKYRRAKPLLQLAQKISERIQESSPPEMKVLQNNPIFVEFIKLNKYD